MKILFRTVHLYLSLAAGLVIAVLCLTGALLVFEHELTEALHPERYHVAAPSTPRRPLQQLVAAAQAARPGATITGLKVYADPARTVEIGLAGEQGKGGKGGPTLFLNPYTGQLISEYRYRDSFFYQVFALHRGMVAGAAGKLVVGVSTLLFLVIIGTGLVLWWPASRRVLRQRLAVKWDASRKRLVHDLHVVLGFYAALFLFVFAFTGLAWSFEWFNRGIFTLTRSEMKGPEPPVVAAGPAGQLLTWDAAYFAARQRVPDATFYVLSRPDAPTEAVRVATTGPGAAYEGATDELYLNPYNGQVVSELAFQDRNLGQRVRRLFKPVHTGAILGLPSKITALLVCLLGGTFPVTGVLMWLNRLKKQKRRAVMA